MTATEALIYCLGWRDDVPVDGEYLSQTAFDRRGNPHWVAWLNGSPQLHSETMSPFSERLEPYDTHARGNS